MARKHLLSDLVPTKLSADNSPSETPPLPEQSAFGARGAIGAVSRSIEMLKSQSISEIDPDLIDAPDITDRLDESEEHFEEFAAQIKEHGQQVPILVRPHPRAEGRYQIAYGRRRLRAVKAAGRLVKAAVRQMTDEELILAQGQENSARKDLSYIEKALYSAELESRGYSRQLIMAALGADKAAVSHLISTAARIPADVIRMIGPAPKAGRDRWVELASRIERKGVLEKIRAQLQGPLKEKSSDERFVRVFEELAPAKKVAPRARVWTADDGVKAAKVRDDDKSLTLIIDKHAAPEFGSYVMTMLPELYRSYMNARNGTNGEEGSN
ncbi:plasmid partitioning protein RepB (plasmid) [Agrobacterium tumefaciens]|nr:MULTISPECIES: plasmid partitioning protein RepB [Rhizobium/Agrobacterium group]NTA46165.1 plasmid partitioning protein RepB [Agrobacterium tumefaciens]NTI46030.1 plasmid partitioning protein RepB [Rhizobium rhizogenes]UXR95361.1 plasmid partitioning protein RepB [Agrobacterium tumefaciens]UXS74287.1 plasmid partitioning protein RepB [Agrobacterium tumefaciens]UXS81951.1 plasmid partitioning protein RepB [Agrobacterium tumefaciens]